MQKQVQGSKLKLIQMLDRLDTGDKHYTRKYQDMQDRLDNLYDKVAEFEEAMKDIDAKIGASYGKEITGKKLYEFLLDFDILYDKMTDMEKKEFMNTFIEKIELKNETVNNGTGQGSRIEHIDLAFPVYYGDCKGTRIRMPEENTVETVCLLGRKIVNDKNVEYAHVDYEPKDAEYLKSAKGSASYREIKEWIKEQHDVSVSNLYIAQVKDKLGFGKRENYNKGADGHRVPNCPAEKEKLILEAFKHFRMI